MFLKNYEEFTEFVVGGDGPETVIAINIIISNKPLTTKII